MIDRKQDHTAVIVVDVQGDFTQARQGSLAVEGTDQAYLDAVAAETRRLKKLGFPVLATQDWHPEFDSYSGFFDDGGHGTGLETVLRNRGIKKLIIYGLTLDYCARATAMDARALGFEVVVIEGLCRGVAPETTRAALEEMAAAGVVFR